MALDKYQQVGEFANMECLKSDTAVSLITDL